MEGNSLNPPLVSVILPVYNGEKFIQKAIFSILNQTYSNFELIIINDGSTDDSLSLIKTFEDERIKLLSFSSNKGIVLALNEGIEIALGKYIARMDCDDFSYQERFQKQVDLLESNPKIGLCGTWLKNISSNKIWKYRPPNDEIIISSKFAPAMAHPTWMGKTYLFKELKYRDKYPYMEDWDLFLRIAKLDNSKNQFANIPECLLDYGTSNKVIQSPPKNRVIDFYKEHFPNLFNSEKDLENFINLNFYPENVKISPKNIQVLLSKLSLSEDFKDIIIEKEKYYYSKYSGTWWNKLIWRQKLRK